MIYCHLAWAFVYHVVMWSSYLPFVCICVQMQTYNKKYPCVMYCTYVSKRSYTVKFGYIAER